MYEKERRHYTLYKGVTPHKATPGDVAHLDDELSVFNGQRWPSVMPGASHPEHGNKICLSAQGLWISARHCRSKRKAEAVVPDNCWVLPLLQRWHQPPLSYYTPVSGTVTAILARLAQLQTPLELLLTRPYKSTGGVTPVMLLVLADILSLKHDLVQYTGNGCTLHAKRG
ncbi:hypothetical protein B0H14DRAFT_2632999 [Mycena olivaceomarginata]|nr:hypothetical protein B0H14DRAFT_2632999 [Mycena olivaceomarginata]